MLVTIWKKKKNVLNDNKSQSMFHKEKEAQETGFGIHNQQFIGVWRPFGLLSFSP